MINAKDLFLDYEKKEVYVLVEEGTEVLAEETQADLLSNVDKQTTQLRVVSFFMVSQAMEQIRATFKEPISQVFILMLLIIIRGSWNRQTEGVLIIHLFKELDFHQLKLKLPLVTLAWNACRRIKSSLN